MSGSTASSNAAGPISLAPRVITTIQAEEAGLLGGAGIAAEARGYEGSGYVLLNALERGDPFAEQAQEPDAAGVTFAFDVPRDGWYTLNFRYANGSDSAAYRNLLVNGEDVPGAVQFDVGFNDSSWATAYDRLPLQAGRTEITLTADMGDEVVGIGTGGASVQLDALEVVAGVSPSDQTSAPALLMNNGEDMVAIHESAQLFAKDTTNFGPFLSQLRHAANWDQDQIDFGAGWFQQVRDDGTRLNYTPNFDSTLYFDEDGIMNVDYGAFLPTGEAAPAGIDRDYAMVPGEPLLVERWTFQNQLGAGQEDITWNFANTLALPDDLAQRAVWDERRETFIVELGQGEGRDPLYLAFGAFQEMQSQDIGEADGNLDATIMRGDGYDPAQRSGDGVLGAFQSDGSLAGGTRGEGNGLTLAMAREEIALRAGAEGEFRSELYFFYTMADSLEALDQQIDLALNPQNTAGAGSPTYWFERTEEAWSERLEAAKELPLVADEAGDGGGGSGSGSGTSGAGTAGSGTPGSATSGTAGGAGMDGASAEVAAGLRPIGDPALETAYLRSLVTILQSQQPEFGSFVAATSPAYDYKVWPRDSAVTAFTLDAAGLHDDAEAYWKWMASIVEDGSNPDPTFERGTFYTNYSFWDAREPIDFVQPEWDAQGLFLMGAARHYLELQEAGKTEQAEAFLNDETVQQAIVWSAEFIRESIDETGFGAPDFSIWEEKFLYNGYTQVTYVAGLQSAALVAEEIGRPELAEGWRSAAGTILDAILRPVDSEDYPGLWDAEEGHFIWGIEPETGQPEDLANAAINLLFVTGLLDPESEKGRSQIDYILENLANDTYGVARYEGDRFYSGSPFSPGGTFESRVDESAWPQMTSYVGMAKEFAGEEDWTLGSLNWQVSVFGENFMPPGEGVDWSTREPLPSTQVEPVTGAWYILNLLNYTNQFDPRLPESDSVMG